MDLDKKYNNRNLEFRRQTLIKNNAATEAMRRSKRRALKPRAEIELVFDFEGDPAEITSHSLAWSIASNGRYSTAAKRQALRDDRHLLYVVADRSSLFDRRGAERYLPAITQLLAWRESWLRKPEAWRPASHNVARQFASLARHLLARYDVPSIFDEVWFRSGAVRQAWFVHVGQGHNLRTADKLPIPLTKMMAHHVMHAPSTLTLTQAMRYGQAKGLGVCERIARAICGSHLGYGFECEQEEAFWATVIGFFARHPMLDPAQIGPITDYLHHQKFAPTPPMVVNGTIVHPGPPQPGLSMKGRDPETLVHQVEAWHRQLARRPRVHDANWVPCGIVGYHRTEGEPGRQRRFTVTELLGSAELRGEGSAMRHCVATYSWSCQSGRTAIFSVKVLDAAGERRMVTCEVNVKLRQIVQIRGRCNALATQMDQRIVSAWATVAGLTFGRFAIRAI